MFRHLLFTVISLSIVSIFVLACSSPAVGEKTGIPPNDGDTSANEPVLLDREIKTLPDGTKYLVHPDDIMSGGPSKDGIPSIDEPNFVSVADADEWIADDELVLVIDHKGVKKVYPYQILVFHEIVNDLVGGDPIVITYCPLCGSGIAYFRQFDGEPVEFGTSGMLYNSNLVMYDRKTDTLWSQVYGVGILGEMTGYRLSPVSLDTVVWSDWKTAHPDSKVLGKDTGFMKQYGFDPYGSYYQDDRIWFPVENEDDSLHPKTVIFGIEIDGMFRAYLEDDVIASGPITDTLNGVQVEVSREDSGVVKVMNIDTAEEIVKERDFWFVWFAFHPETTVYGRE